MQRGAGELPIVVLTSSDDDRMAIAAVQAGAQDYLVKSSTDAQLLARSLRYARERIAFPPGADRTRGQVPRARRSQLRRDHLIDRSFVALYNSRAIETVTGYRPEELYGRRLDTLVHTDDVRALRGALAACLEEPGEDRGARIPFPSQRRLVAVR